MRNKKNETITLKKGSKEVQLDYANLRRAVLVLRAVNHKLRQRVIDLLEENDTMTVTDIYIKLRLEQSVASQHLAILRRAGVVVTARSGKFIYYSLDRDRLSQISKLVKTLQVERIKKKRPLPGKIHCIFYPFFFFSFNTPLLKISF